MMHSVSGNSDIETAWDFERHYAQGAPCLCLNVVTICKRWLSITCSSLSDFINKACIEYMKSNEEYMLATQKCLSEVSATALKQIFSNIGCIEVVMLIESVATGFLSTHDWKFHAIDRITQQKKVHGGKIAFVSFRIANEKLKCPKRS